MRFRSRRRLPAALALVATLLLALVPTLGRVAGDGVPTRIAFSASASAEPASAGPGHAIAPGGAHGTDPSPAPHRDHGGDCAYCPLLGSLLAPALATVPAPLPHGEHACPTGEAPAARDRHPCGLGSRGPPALA